MLYRLIEIYQLFGGIYCVHFQGKSESRKQPVRIKKLLGYLLGLNVEPEGGSSAFPQTWVNGY
jgi:hypothetical protein